MLWRLLLAVLATIAVSAVSYIFGVMRGSSTVLFIVGKRFGIPVMREVAEAASEVKSKQLRGGL